MAEPTSPSTPPVTRTICPKCGLPMFLVRVGVRRTKPATTNASLNVQDVTIPNRST